MSDLIRINELRDKVLGGGMLSADEAYELSEFQDRKALRDAAALITSKFNTPDFDSCSIVNARSGRCSENCKWCAQSAHYHTDCEEYESVDYEECMKSAAHNASKGVKRFSLVASGRKMQGKALDHVCGILHDVKEKTGISTCASLGLLNEEDLKKLWEAGVRRYHCNLEAAPSYFTKLCTTHTIDDKLDTIRKARALGFQICSGGIIGMGENRRQRVELALKLREAEPDSIPVNILCPIPGTPLADTEPISEDEIIDTVAFFRFVHPSTQLRFAGGRKRLSREVQIECMRVGMNGGITGDLLTTVGSSIDEDRKLVSDAGYKF